MKGKEMRNNLRDIYVKVVLYTNSLYTWWEIIFAFIIGIGLGFYFAY
jgi:hypothetical protein